jgi:hypothetical protein
LKIEDYFSRNKEKENKIKNQFGNGCFPEKKAKERRVKAESCHEGEDIFSQQKPVEYRFYLV